MPKLKPEDISMTEAADAKVQKLEQQVLGMQKTIDTMSHAQASHVQNVQSQLDSHAHCIQKLDTKVDANHNATTQKLQQKLDEQMSKIAELFNKRKIVEQE